MVAERTADWNFLAVRENPAEEIAPPMRLSTESPSALSFSTLLSRNDTLSARYLTSASFSPPPPPAAAAGAARGGGAAAGGGFLAEGVRERPSLRETAFQASSP